MRTPRRANRRALPGFVAVAAIAALLVPVAPRASAADDSTPIVIRGGGWGHGIGMPQWAARGQAEDGDGWRDILRYWYDGVGFTNVDNIPGVPSTIRVGIDYVLVGGVPQYRPFRWQDFVVEQDEGSDGEVEMCLPGEDEGSCSIEIDAGATWRYRWFDAEGGYCSLTRDGAVVYSDPTDCDLHLYWTDQPHTRIDFPGADVARTFARGSIAFEGPLTVNSQTGFHLVILLDIDEYIYGLAEMPVSWPMGALKAQVVAARTYGAWRARGGIRPECSCHLRWDTRDQSYRGWHPLNEGNPDQGQRWRKAVDRTAGKVVVHPDGTTSIAETYYFSSSGGATENVWEVWGPDTPQYREKYAYLSSQPDEWSERFSGEVTESTTIRWLRNRTAGGIVTALAEDSHFPHLGELVSITIEGVRTSGSPDRIAVTGLAAGQPAIEAFTGNQLASYLGLTSHYIYSFEGLDPIEWPLDDNRSETAAAASLAWHPDGAGTVYLTPGSEHIHALGLSPAAAADGAPVLLLQSDGDIPDATATELARLDPDRVVVAAPEEDVSDGILDELEGMLPGADVVRVAGSNRYKSAAALSAQAFGPGVATVWVTARNPYPEGLIAAAEAAAAGAPLLAVKPDKVPKATRDELTRLDPDRIVVVGSPAEVSAAVLSSLGSYAPEVERYSASNRFALSVDASQGEYPAGSSTVYVAVGRSHAQALAGSSALAADPGPLLLVRKHRITAAVLAEIERLAPARIVVLSAGGDVGADLLADLATLVAV